MGKLVRLNSGYQVEIKTRAWMYRPNGATGVVRR